MIIDIDINLDKYECYLNDNANYCKIHMKKKLSSSEKPEEISKQQDLPALWTKPYALCAVKDHLIPLLRKKEAHDEKTVDFLLNIVQEHQNILKNAIEEANRKIEALLSAQYQQELLPHQPNEEYYPNVLDYQDAEGRTALFYAVQNQHTPVCEKLLKMNADPCLRTKTDLTTLHVAQDPKIMGLMLTKPKMKALINYRPNQNGDSPLVSHIKAKRPRCIQVLLENEVEVTWHETAQHYSSRPVRIYAIEQLIFALPAEDILFKILLDEKYNKTHTVLFKKTGSDSLFFHATRHGATVVVEYILKLRGEENPDYMVFLDLFSGKGKNRTAVFDLFFQYKGYRDYLTLGFLNHMVGEFNPEGLLFLIDKIKPPIEKLTFKPTNDRATFEKLCDRGVFPCFEKTIKRQYDWSEMQYVRVPLNVTYKPIFENKLDDYFQKCCLNYQKIISSVVWKEDGVFKPGFTPNHIQAHAKIIQRKINPPLMPDLKLFDEDNPNPDKLHPFAPYYHKMLMIKDDAAKALQATKTSRDPRVQELYRLLAEKPTLVLCDSNYQKFIQWCDRYKGNDKIDLADRFEQWLIGAEPTQGPFASFSDSAENSCDELKDEGTGTELTVLSTKVHSPKSAIGG